MTDMHGKDGIDKNGKKAFSDTVEFRPTGDWLKEELNRRGVSRRQFLTFCSGMATALALPATFGARIARAVESTPKPTLVWLEFQDCCGNTESFLRASRPTVADIILDTISVDYHETLMAAAGHQAEKCLAEAIERDHGAYIAVVEGSIPTGAGGAYCTIGGRSALDIVNEVCGGAAVTVAIGTCASFGGLPAAAPNPTGALSVADAVPGLNNLINMPACPANGENLAALIVYYLTFGRLPELDAFRRPRFAYGKLIHDACEKRGHYDAGQYTEQWGDAGHRRGYCLYKMGCKGPVTYQNCPNVGWNEGTNWPVGCGHPCIGCSEPSFWDRMTPFYRHLPEIPGLGPHTSLDKIGFGTTIAVGGAFAAHTAMHVAKKHREQAKAAASEEGEE
jgi:hydrogenase small subunit